MTAIEFLARSDKVLRPLAVKWLSPSLTVSLYSKTRASYLARLCRDIPPAIQPPEELRRTLWGLEFRSPIFNAAGMFKNAEGYQLSAAQGAGAYLAGTTTGPARKGNLRNGIYLPFAPYPGSASSSNWLGLPNDGDQAVAARLARLPRVLGCPIGISVMGSPNLEGEQRLETLISGLRGYQAAGVDFIEINESCPNTAEGAPQENELFSRLSRIAEAFLQHRFRRIPVIVKFSLDTELQQIAPLCKMLVDLGFDGITLGNTSVRYQQHRAGIRPEEQDLYDYFTSTFGGGLGGEVVRDSSRALLREAKAALDALEPSQEFHIIRTGGVSSAADVAESLAAGASLVQWYTGYFESFGAIGHAVYDELYAALLRTHGAA